LGIRRRDFEPVVVLQLVGSFFSEDELQKAFAEVIKENNLKLVLNLEGCQRMNSVAIGAIMRGFANYRGRGGEVRLCCLPKQIMDLLTMTKLLQIFEVFNAEEEAVASFA